MLSEMNSFVTYLAYFFLFVCAFVCVRECVLRSEMNCPELILQSRIPSFFAPQIAAKCICALLTTQCTQFIWHCQAIYQYLPDLRRQNPKKVGQVHYMNANICLYYMCTALTSLRKAFVPSVLFDGPRLVQAAVLGEQHQLQLITAIHRSPFLQDDVTNPTKRALYLYIFDPLCVCVFVQSNKEDCICIELWNLKNALKSCARRKNQNQVLRLPTRSERNANVKW